MTKTRYCKRGCGLPALPKRQFCYWHALMRESADEQAAEANRRLMRVPEDQRITRMSPKEWPDGMRWCAGCQSYVPKFYTSGSRCKACASIARHAKSVEKTYGITAERYEELLAKQDGRCAICRTLPRKIRLAVDHDHRTGEVRGLLCKRCNHDLLGGGHDSIYTLWNAMVYLIHPPAQCAPGWEPPVGLTLDVLRRALDER